MWQIKEGSKEYRDFQKYCREHCPARKVQDRPCPESECSAKCWIFMKELRKYEGLIRRRDEQRRS